MKTEWDETEVNFWILSEFQKEVNRKEILTEEKNKNSEKCKLH